MTEILADVAPEPEGVAAEVLAIGAGVFVAVAIVVGLVLWVKRTARAKRDA
ncbi:hypothetical protein GCM10009682_56730 [Luedemannella flava]|uniref:Uncharacterized protein n=1 Tax=Luedemannella flava TaxID=349316 RepID=A0ABN2MM48_9ACTN